MKVFLKTTFILGSTLLSLPVARAATDAPQAAANQQRVRETYGRLPLSFTVNQGQADPRVAYLAQGSGYSIALGRARAEVTLRGRASGTVKQRHGVRDVVAAGQDDGATMDASLQLSFPGTGVAAAVAGMEELPGKSNYLIGNDASKWHVGVPNYARVRYEALYPGIDLVYYGNQRQMEFDFVVAPRADPSAIRLKFEGTVGEKPVELAVNAAGDLVAAGEDGRVLLHKPLLYQMAVPDAGGVAPRQAVEGGFVLDGAHQVRFKIGAYDQTRELIIDPTLAYSTNFGGYGTVGAQGLAVDAKGDAYVTGSTYGGSYPATPGALQPIDTGSFVSKFNSSGTALLYSTYVGVVGDNAEAIPIAVDAEGNAYIAGGSGPGFPTTPGAFQRTFAGRGGSFVAKLNTTGTAFLYSTYLNGPRDIKGFTTIRTIAVDQAGNAYVAGDTSSKDFPVTRGVFQPRPAPLDPHLGGVIDSSFLAKLNPSGSGLVYSTFLSRNDAAVIALDAADNAYVLGSELATNLEAYPTTAGVFSITGQFFLAKVNSTASKLVYYTRLREFTTVGLAVDPGGNAYLTGGVSDKGAPTYPGLPETLCYPCGNAFVLKLNTTASALVYSAFLGKSVIDIDNPNAGTATLSSGIAVDAAGNAYITGSTNDPNFPITADAVQTVIGDQPGSLQSGDAFLTKLDPSGTRILYSTFLGGRGSDSGNFIALDQSGDAFIAGDAEGSNFPTTPNAFQSSGSDYAAFLSKFSFGEPFCSFKADLRLDEAPSQEHAFALEASFALGTSALLQPETVPLTIKIGSQSITIPAGQLVRTSAGYSFQGAVDDIRLSLLLRQTGDGTGTAAGSPCSTPTYTLVALGRGGSFANVNNPVNVSISIGESSGSIVTDALIYGGPKRP